VSDNPDELYDHYRREGYAVCRGLFGAAELAAIAASFDRFYEQGIQLGRSWRHGNLFFRVVPDEGLGRVVRLVQWPAYDDPVLARVRTDPRLLRLVEPLVGRDLKQIINQLHWKPPGAAMVDFAFHQDCRFRRPASAFRDLATSYVQTGLAVDPHTVENGAMRVLPRSHLMGDLGLGDEGPVLGQTMRDAALVAKGLDPDDLVDLVLEPGDVAFWSPYLVHGSGPNRTGGDRRLYINGYVMADKSDRGEWAFRGGQPAPLTGEPALIHFDRLREKPQPHYVDEEY
jgi:ectoine hydroxylase-related dioxygenase (phytanoyl-CoA dioxygenase family)